MSKQLLIPWEGVPVTRARNLTTGASEILELPEINATHGEVSTGGAGRMVTPNVIMLIVPAAAGTIWVSYNYTHNRNDPAPTAQKAIQVSLPYRMHGGVAPLPVGEWYHIFAPDGIAQFAIRHDEAADIGILYTYGRVSPKAGIFR